MKRFLAAMALLICWGLDANPQKATSIDMRTAKTIFIDWVDISLDSWAILGYGSEQDWAEKIDWGNAIFKNACMNLLTNREITFAKNRSDENASGKDLCVKFSNVRFDNDSYALYAAIHFVDPKTGSGIASVPTQRYRGGRATLSNCLSGAMEKLAEKVQEEIEKSPRK